jgi:hypothetical protein
VQQPQPEVQVQQKKPEVDVIQPKPEVVVKQQQPDVQVSQQQPQVDVEQKKPEVQVQQAEPRVQVEQAEPQVSVQQQKPEVTVKEQGQPQVIVEDEEKEQPEPQARAEQPQAGQAQEEQRQVQTERTLWSLTPSQLAGTTVHNNLGQEIGDIDKLVMDPQSQALAAVISVGGFLGLGQKQIAVDVSNLYVDQNRVFLDTRRSEDQLENRPEYNAQQYQAIPPTNETIGQLMQGGQ